MIDKTHTHGNILMTLLKNVERKKTRKKSALLYNSGFIQKRPEGEIRNVQVLYNLLKRKLN